MKFTVLYHGSDKIIKKPLYGYGNKHNDYGLGFYCTKDIELAKEWANKDNEHGYVNIYKVSVEKYKILDLTDKTKYSILNWLAILLHYRSKNERFYKIREKEFLFLEKYFIDPTQFDFVIGYRADDAYFSFPLAFIDNQLTLQKLEEIYLLGDLGVQIVAISKAAMDSFVYTETLQVEPTYKRHYLERKNIAIDKFHKIMQENRYEKGDRILDLINKNDK